MMKNNHTVVPFFIRILSALVTLCYCGVGLAVNTTTNINNDPFERYNRIAFSFNDTLDIYILKPIATGYNTVVPMPIRDSVNHFYNNIDTLPIIINDLLQANFYQATSDTWRLFINSTAGLLGFFDVASRIGLEANGEEDLGLTFARWGWSTSNYFVIPLFGPSTVRDAIAKPIQYEYMTIYPYISNTTDMYLLYGGSVINTRAQLLKLEGVMKQAAIDKYVFQRNAYLQHRAYLIQRNRELDNPYLMDDQDFEQGDESI